MSLAPSPQPNDKGAASARAFPPDGVPSGARRAALVVHAMAQADREWLLQRLPPHERRDLEGLLAELAELGIPGDPGLVRAATAGASPGGACQAVGASAPDPARDGISRAGAPRVADALAHEPAGVIALLLAAQEWPWRGELLIRLGPAKRHQVEDHEARLRGSGSAPAATAITERVVAALSRRLATASASRPHTASEPAPGRNRLASGGLGLARLWFALTARRGGVLR